MDDVEVRDLRYFVAVAEELHFGRAAEVLRIAQPALSKAIQRLERRLGVELFTRTSRSVALTSAGAALLEHGRHALNAIAVAVQAARRAGEATSIQLAMKPGGDAGLLSTLLQEYANHPGARQVDIMFHPGVERAALVRDGRADAALLYSPFESTDGLMTATLHVEDRVAVLPVGHRLADSMNISLDELDNDTFPRWFGRDDDGTGGPAISDVAELFPLVRLGRVVAVLPRSLAGLAGEGTVSVPVSDASPSAIVIGCRADDDRGPMRALMTAARSVSSD
ncbi:LysR family transcriptional regulator [Brachybacterium alimentarium]|uniref:LysR family transcriptional regulator n=1 Tax=Brachybacterium alimentarium TaxID=47845 RepID=UPI003FD68732